MALVFPEDRNSYLGELRFTLVDKDGKPKAGGSVGEGLNPTQVTGSTVQLYLPQGLQIGDKVEYENADLGAVGAAIAGGGSGQEAGAASESLFSEDVQKKLLGDIVSKFSAKAGQIAAARNRISPNPNTRALFKQVSLRSFAFSFKLVPRSETEAENIKEIIQFFRKEMYPTDIETTIGEQTLSLGYNFPDRFLVEMIYDNEIVGPKIAPAYLDSFSTNFNASSQTFFKSKDGKNYFSEIDINFTMTESKALSRKDIEAGF